MSKFLNFLSALNTSRVSGSRYPAFARQMLSLERRLLSVQSEKLDAASQEVELFWDAVSTHFENQRRSQWLYDGVVLNLSSPKSLAEKLEWLKFNDHRRELVRISDKLAVRDYVLEKTGDAGLLNRIYGVYERSRDIPFGDLPARHIVKSNHWSGNVLICRDGQPIQASQLADLDRQLNSKYAARGVEWPYWHIKAVAIVEEYLEDQFGQLIDYKVHCFNGQPKFVMVVKDRFDLQSRLMFDLDWKLLPFRYKKYPPIKEGQSFPRPKSLEDMLSHASKLCKGLAFARADFYDIYGECRFGEMTLYPDSGLRCILHPSEWNDTVGSWISLPESNRDPQFAYGAAF